MGRMRAPAASDSISDDHAPACVRSRTRSRPSEVSGGSGGASGRGDHGHYHHRQSLCLGAYEAALASLFPVGKTAVEVDELKLLPGAGLNI
jgi:hypothetical protein